MRYPFSPDNEGKKGEDDMRTKKLVSILLMLIMVCVGASAVFAEPSPQPRYTGIVMFSASLTKEGNVVYPEATMILKDDYDGSIVGELQERAPGGAWHTVATFYSQSNYSVRSLLGNYTGMSGYSYRTLFSFNAYDANGTLVDHQVRYSSIQTV